jgi:hypothetical protein
VIPLYEVPVMLVYYNDYYVIKNRYSFNQHKTLNYLGLKNKMSIYSDPAT